MNSKRAEMGGRGSGAGPEVGVDLDAAARKLGVHYQTAYRWVRTGVLPAVKIGAGYRIEDDDVERLLAEQRREPALAVGVAQDWGAHRAALRAALRTGEETTALDLVDKLQAGGAPPLDLCELLISPVLRQVGEDVEAGVATTADVSVAARICERVVGSLVTPPRGRPRGLAVVAGPEGEQHRLPGLMATACLRADRWRVHHLGCDVPVGEIVAFVDVAAPDVVVLSVTVAGEAGRAVRDRLASAHVRVLTGGPGASLGRLIGELTAPGPKQEKTDKTSNFP